jgi:hypothetical protein
VVLTDSGHPMLRSHADAVQRMMDSPPTDPRNWEQQAEMVLMKPSPTGDGDR